jgi:hypothetical protein
VDISGNLVGSAGTTSTAGNDTFIADNTQTNKVTSAADVLNGGSGTDTLTVYGELATTPQISNIEKIVLDTFADGKSANFASTTGVTNVTVVRAAGAATVSVNDGVAVALENNADATKALTVNFGSTDTSASLSLNKVTGNTGVDLAVTGTKVATLNLSTTGAASTIGTLNGDATLTKIVVTGDQNLTVTDALEATITNVDASAFTGKLSIKTTTNGTPDATTGGVDTTDLTITGGSGNDTIDISGNGADNEVSINAGAGDDKVVIVKTATAAYSAATSTNAGDSIVGGDGTDTLSVDGDLTADLSGVVSGFEILEVTADSTQAMATNKLGINSFLMTGDGVDLTLTGLAAGATVKGTAATAGDITATIGTDTTADVINVEMESAGATAGSTITLNNYDTLNLSSTKAAADAATVANTVAAIAATSVSALNISGTQDLTITTAALKAAAAVTNTATGAVTSTFTTSVKTYTGGTGADTLSLVAGDLKQGNTFAGGAGTDSLTVTASASQDMGIVGLTGFETLNLTTDGANVGDFRNVTDLATIKVAATAGTDDLTLNRLSADTTLSFGTSIDQVVTTIASGASQKVAFHAAATVASLTLDSGTTALTVTSDDGDATTAEAIGNLTVTGTSLASITVLGNDDLNLNTLANTVTTVDASASKGNLTVTASDAVNTSITGSQVADTITGGAKDDTITGGKGDDILDGAGGHDSFVFADTGANNGADTLTFTAGAGASGDILNFKNFLSGGSVDQNGGTGTAIVAYGTASTSDVNITNKVALYSDATEANIDTATEIAALIQGAGDAFSLTAGGKTILLTGDAASAADPLNIWFVNDALDGVSGTVSATDVVLVGTIATTDLDTLITSNFAFA